RLEQAPSREILQARHEGKTEQVTQAKHLVRAPRRVDDMGADGQLRVIFEYPVQDIEGLTLGARNHLRVEDTILIREVRIHTHGAVVIAQVAGIEGREQSTASYAEALAV